MSRFAARILCGFGVVGAGVCSPASAQRLELVPFADIRQVADIGLSGAANQDVTYTEVSTGIAARTNTRRIVASLGYRFSYRIPEAGQSGNTTQHNGEGRMQMEVIENWLTLDTGVLATQSRVDAGGASPQFNSVDNNNLTQTYSAYIQPTTRHHIGEFDMSATYRLGYVKNEAKSPATSGPITNRFSSSINQQGTVQAGMGIGTLPFEWNLTGQAQLENTDQLDQKFEQYSGSLNIKYPVADTVAVVGSGGYESSRQTNRETLLDPLTGLPVLNSGGGFVSDLSQPRKLIYDQSGLIADIGVAWRPTRRTRVEARVGRRYGDLTYSGLIEMEPGKRSKLNVVVSDRLNSFGRAVTGGLANAPAQLQLGNDPQTAFQTCLFGVSGNGSCLGGALGQASASTYRDRSVTAIFSRQLRQAALSVSGGYTRRTYIGDPNDPFSLNGVTDQIFYLQGSGSLQMARDSGLTFAFSANWFKNGQVGVGDVLSYSANTSYYRLIGRGLRAEATLGLESSKQEGFTADMSGRAQLGVHYDF